MVAPSPPCWSGLRPSLCDNSVAYISSTSNKCQHTDTTWAVPNVLACKYSFICGMGCRRDWPILMTGQLKPPKTEISQNKAVFGFKQLQAGTCTRVKTTTATDLLQQLKLYASSPSCCLFILRACTSAGILLTWFCAAYKAPSQFLQALCLHTAACYNSHTAHSVLPLR